MCLACVGMCLPACVCTRVCVCACVCVVWCGVCVHTHVCVFCLSVHAAACVLIRAVLLCSRLSAGTFALRALVHPDAQQAGHFELNQGDEGERGEGGRQ